MIRSNPVHRVHSVAQLSHVLIVRRLDVPQPVLPIDHLLEIASGTYPVGELQISHPMPSQSGIRYALVSVSRWHAGVQRPEPLDPIFASWGEAGA